MTPNYTVILRPRYIQRITILEEAKKGSITGPDSLFTYHYMGAAEFEFGALPASAKRVRDAVDGFSIVQTGVCRLPTKAEVLQLYLNINAGGTPHTAAEIERVRALLAAERAKGESR